MSNYHYSYCWMQHLSYCTQEILNTCLPVIESNELLYVYMNVVSMKKPKTLIKMETYMRLHHVLKVAIKH